MTEKENGEAAPTCATCAHSHEESPDAPVIFCRAHPPHALLTDISRDPTQGRSTGVNYWCVFPTVQRGWVCSEHKARTARPSAVVVDLSPKAKAQGQAHEEKAT